MDRFGAAYITAVGEAGFDCQGFEDSAQIDSNTAWPDRMARLRKWVTALPKPIAVLAFSDIEGRRIAEACRMEGVVIPDQIALIGGEHDELFCQVTRPPLSGIDLSPQRIGWEAAGLLTRLMDGEPPPAEPIRVPPARIIARQSTDTLAVDDPLIVQAMRFILNNACRSITVSDVLRAVPISRRVLEQRFQKVIGRSPAAEIRRVRMERAKKLLAESDHPMAQIATECGFEHAEVFARVFRTQEGVKPTTYRKQVRTD